MCKPETSLSAKVLIYLVEIPSGHVTLLFLGFDRRSLTDLWSEKHVFIWTTWCRYRSKAERRKSILIPTDVMHFYTNWGLVDYISADKETSVFESSYHSPCWFTDFLVWFFLTLCTLDRSLNQKERSFTHSYNNQLNWSGSHALTDFKQITQMIK